MFADFGKMLFHVAMVARNNAATRAMLDGIGGRVVRGGIATHVVLHPRQCLRGIGDVAVGAGHGLAHLVGRGHAPAVIPGAGPLAPLMGHDLNLANSMTSAFGDSIIDTTAQIANQPNVLHNLGNNLDLLQQATEAGFRAVVDSQRHYVIGGLAIGGCIFLGHKFMSSRSAARQILNTHDIITRHVSSQVPAAIEATASNVAGALVPAKAVVSKAPFLTGPQVTVLVVFVVSVTGAVCIIYLHTQNQRKLAEMKAKRGYNE